MRDAIVLVVGRPDFHRTAMFQEQIWLLVGGGWNSHCSLAFYLGLHHRGIGNEDILAKEIANMVAEAATYGHCLDEEEVAEVLREYLHARRILRKEPQYQLDSEECEPETAA